MEHAKTILLSAGLIKEIYALARRNFYAYAPEDFGYPEDYAKAEERKMAEGISGFTPEQLELLPDDVTVPVSIKQRDFIRNSLRDVDAALEDLGVDPQIVGRATEVIKIADRDFTAERRPDQPKVIVPAAFFKRGPRQG